MRFACLLNTTTSMVLPLSVTRTVIFSIFMEQGTAVVGDWRSLPRRREQSCFLRQAGTGFSSRRHEAERRPPRLRATFGDAPPGSGPDLYTWAWSGGGSHDET